MNDLGLYLHVPNSKRCKFRGNHRLLLKHWFNNHPSPSWQLVEEALFQLGEYDVLKQVQEIYSSLQEDPLSKLFSWILGCQLRLPCKYIPVLVDVSNVEFVWLLCAHIKKHCIPLYNSYREL